MKKTRLQAFCLAAAAPFFFAAAHAQEGSESSLGSPDPGRAFSALVRKLEAENWAPAFFTGGRVSVFDPIEEDRRLRAMMEEPPSMMTVGMYAYRVSPARSEEGRRLFFRYDWGSAESWRSNERYMLYALKAASAEDLAKRFGIPMEPGGHLAGYVGMPTPDGKTDFGWSCALCHAAAGPDGALVAGAPNHGYQYALSRHEGLVAHDPHPAFAGPGFIDRDIPAEKLASLGPGLIDRNGDRIANPVKIPALWGLRSIRSGVYANGAGANIWFALGRHNGGVHPSSEYLEALVSFLLTLEPPPNPKPKGEAETRGEAVFRKAGCDSCHSGPDYTNGEVIPIGIIGTDEARVGLEFPRGYRGPTLRRLDLVRLFLHDGSVKTLPDLFDRGRLTKAKGHEYGMDLTGEEKKALVAFLLSI